MASLIVYYAHPAQRQSRANRVMAEQARTVAGLSFVDLYAEYPRFDIDVDIEQRRLVEHDVIVLQFPLFWYSAPAIVKEWYDLVLEHGFAYGAGGDRLAGKTMMLAVTAGGPLDAYEADGYQRHPLRTFLIPHEQTARLCRMQFVAPYVLYGSLHAVEDGLVAPHAAGYARLLEAIVADSYDLTEAARREVVDHRTLPLRERA